MVTASTGTLKLHFLLLSLRGALMRLCENLVVSPSLLGSLVTLTRWCRVSECAVLVHRLDVLDGALGTALSYGLSCTVLLPSSRNPGFMPISPCRPYPKDDPKLRAPWVSTGQSFLSTPAIHGGFVSDSLRRDAKHWLPGPVMG